MMRHVRYTQFSPESRAAFELFSKKEGAQYIATPVTLEAMLDMDRDSRMARVLEMGAGIGTITYTLLKYTNAHVDTYEDNEFCKAALKTNLTGFEDRYTLLTDYKIDPPARVYDLVVIDGGGGKGEDGGTMPIVQKIAAHIDARTYYIEGGRHQQRTLLRRELAKRFVYRLVQYDYATYMGVSYKGGLAIVCMPASSALLRKLNFYYWELIEWTPVKYAIQYRWGQFKKRLGI
jgi:hypothetical protein